MLNQDVKAEKLFMDSVAILRGLSVHSHPAAGSTALLYRAFAFLRTAQKECKRKIKPLPVLLSSRTLKHSHSIARRLFSI